MKARIENLFSNSVCDREGHDWWTMQDGSWRICRRCHRQEGHVHYWQEYLDGSVRCRTCGAVLREASE